MDTVQDKSKASTETKTISENPIGNCKNESVATPTTAQRAHRVRYATIKKEHKSALKAVEAKYIAYNTAKNKVRRKGNKSETANKVNRTPVQRYLIARDSLLVISSDSEDNDSEDNDSTNIPSGEDSDSANIPSGEDSDSANIPSGEDSDSANILSGKDRMKIPSTIIPSGKDRMKIPSNKNRNSDISESDYDDIGEFSTYM